MIRIDFERSGFPNSSHDAYVRIFYRSTWQFRGLNSPMLRTRKFLQSHAIESLHVLQYCSERVLTSLLPDLTPSQSGDVYRVFRTNRTTWQWHIPEIIWDENSNTKILKFYIIVVKREVFKNNQSNSEIARSGTVKLIIRSLDILTLGFSYQNLRYVPYYMMRLVQNILHIHMFIC